MLGFKRTSGIPHASNVPNMKLISYLHKSAVENDIRAKPRMQAEYDSRMRAKKCTIAISCKVLIKQERVNKSTSPWDPKPFLGTSVNGSMITAARHDKETKFETLLSLSSIDLKKRNKKSISFPQQNHIPYHRVSILTMILILK